jgi:thiosulfate/3-mercaptopyruvate sulfurtransferase
MSMVSHKNTDGRGAHLRAGVLVDSSWLAEHLYDPMVHVVEIDVSRALYDDWHIDGALLWNIYSDLKDTGYRLVDRASLDALVARSGIRRDSTVVFYGYAPAFAFWLLKLYGHPDVRILDCHRDTWRAEGRPWSTTAPQPAIGGWRIGQQDCRIQADRHMVEDAIDRSGTTIVDVRTEAEFRGERFWPSGASEPGGRAGHVPGAVHLPLDDLYNENGSFRPASELRTVFCSLDLRADDELITYCTIGGRAATAWFVLTYLLGRSGVRVYDGSWAEWGRTADTLVEAF